MSPGMAVRAEASMKVPAGRAALARWMLWMRLPCTTMSTFSRAVSLTPSTSRPTRIVVRPVGTAGVQVRFSGTSVVSPVSMLTMRSLSID
jgi:hypothetical protein